MIDLDFNAGGAIDAEVLTVLVDAYREYGSNPASAHSQGARTKAALEDARRSILSVMNAGSSHTLVFTSGATEGLNMVMHGMRWGRLLVSSTEHLSLLKLAERSRRDGRIETTTIRVDRDGVLDGAQLERELGLGPALVVVQSANGDTGVLQPISDIAAIAGGQGCSLLVDGTQAAAWVSPDLSHSKNVILVLGGRKLGAPHSIGALVIPRDLLPLWRPLTIGGGHEFGVRAGTPAVPECVALAAACAMATEKSRASRVKSLRDRFEYLLVESISGVRFYGRAAKRLPNTCAFVVDGIDAERLQRDVPDLLFGRGAACSSGAHQRSHVLSAMGAPVSDLHDLVRVSLGPKVTLQDIEKAVSFFVRGVDAQRGNRCA